MLGFQGVTSIAVVCLAYFGTSAAEQLSTSPAASDVADVSGFLAIDPERTESKFIFPNLCFKGGVTSPRPGTCVAPSRCRSSDIAGSGACRSGQICCEPQNVGTGRPPGGVQQQLVKDCGIPTPNSVIFPSRSPGRFRASSLLSDGSNTREPARIRRGSKFLDLGLIEVNPPIQPDVVGGVDVTVTASLPVGQWPWMALLGYNTPDGRQWKCGGVVLSRDVVLTAAHCVSGLRDRPEELTVRLGEYDISTVNDGPGRHVDVGVARVVVHPDYRGGQNDIALLRLTSNVTFSARVRPVCLPPRDSAHTGRHAELAGWGRIGFGERTSDVLQEATVLVVDEDSCEAAYKGLGLEFERKFPGGFQGTKVCATGEDGKSRDACQGDSGGPLVVKDAGDRYQLIGVVSGGNGCGNPDYPGIYTKVSKYIAWIISNSE